MKYLFFFLAGVFNFFYCSSQVSKKYTVPAGSTIAETIPFNELYVYPAFTEGQVYFKNGMSYPVKLNYNFLESQMQFIDPNGDTLNIADVKKIKYIAVAADTFYFDKVYLQQLAGNNTGKILVSEKLKVGDKQKISGYEMPTSTAAIDSYNTYVTGNHSYNLTTRENLLLAKESKYYLGDASNHLMDLNKKNIYKLFPLHENEVADYLKENSINFNKQEDVIKFSGFLFSLKEKQKKRH